MSDGTVTFSSIRFVSAVMLAHCRSNALSKALRAVFFSVAVHVSSYPNRSMDSIDDLPLCVRCLRVEAGRGDHNSLELRLQPEKRDHRNVAQVECDRFRLVLISAFQIDLRRIA